ncbi:MAG: GIY-YIG nuclease family protein, partial [Limisphaerales bacterium]
MHFVYVLQSESDGGGSYIGYTANLDRRLNEHIEGKSFATSFRGPWELIYYEAYRNREDAMGRERFLK